MPTSTPRALRRLALPLVAALTATLAPAAVPQQAAGATSCTWTPFRSSPSKHTWYRIPSVVRSPGGPLVAVAERRDRELGDVGDFDIVVARSTDRGCTWSTPKTLASDGTNRVSNPVPIADAVTGQVLVLSTVSPRTTGGRLKGVYLQSSDDDGATFSAFPTQRLTIPGFKGGLTGPSRGIQLTVHHPGRLLFPMGYKTPSGHYGAYGIYSDDHGTTWQVGYDQEDSTGSVDYIEGSVTELPDGRLFITYRNNQTDYPKAGTSRRQAYSEDGGDTLAAPFAASTLPVVNVQGSALALGGTGTGTLVFSAPSDPTPTLRRRMALFASTTGGTSWRSRYSVTLEDFPDSYSDVIQDGGYIGVLYETGVTTWKERIVYRRVLVSDLASPKKAPSTLTYTRSSKATASGAHARVKVTVTVPGIEHPPGKVTVSATRKGTTKSASITFTYSNGGVRYVDLPVLKAGSYDLAIVYSGTERISKDTVDAGTLTVR